MDYKRGIRSHRPISTILNKSKGHISLFLIVAVVLLLIISGYFIINNYFNRDKFTTNPLDPSLTSVQKFVIGCIEKTTRAGIELAAVQGGYITLPPEIERNPRMYVSTHPDGGIKTPIWIGSGGTSYMPTIEQLQKQLENHIDTTIGYCLTNLSEIAQISDIDVFSIPKSTVSFNEKDVSVILNYEVGYNERQKTLRESQFTFKLDVPLRLMMEESQKVAKKIYDEEFLPYATIDLFSIADETQIPLSNMKLQCSTPTWKVEDVRTNITRLLTQMIPRIRVAGAQGLPFEAPDSTYTSLQRITPDDFSEPAVGYKPIKQLVPRGYANAPSDTYEYNHLFIQPENEDILEKNKLTMSFGYLPSYGLDMQVRPSDNGIMYGTSGQGERNYLSFLCVQVYHFTYDLIFPVEIVMFKENAFKDGSPLALRFALPVQIQRNTPNQDDFNIETIANTPGGQLCDQRLSYQTQIIATDFVTKEPINDAKVEFHCYKYSCDLGTTSKLQSSWEPELTTSIPSFCSGGSISISHPQYITNEEAFYEAPQKVNVELLPLRNVTFSVMLGANPALLGNTITATPLNENQNAIIHIESQNVDYVADVSYNNDDTVQHIIKLIGAKEKYNVTVLVYETTDEEEGTGSLIGGYMGEFEAKMANLNQRLTFYTYDFGQPVPSEELTNALTRLSTDEIISQHTVRAGVK